MDTEKAQYAARDVMKKIVEEFKPEKIILYGSFAWGTPHDDSDLDFFIIKNTNLPSLKRIEFLDGLFSRREFPMDFLVYTPDQVRRQLTEGDFFVKEIMTRGKVLYDSYAKN